jgi:dissimilatory sulfite reductase (desulfoviridin) alpha/beta subunit
MTHTKSKAAASKSGTSVVIGGKKFTIASKLPFRFLKAAQDENLTEIIEILLGEQADQFWALDLSIPEGTEAVQKLVEKAGASLGES